MRMYLGKINIMTKFLKVINPFFTTQLGDRFEFDNKKKMYVLDTNEEFHKIHDDDSSEITSTYTSTFEISVDYAKMLIDEGYLEEVKDDEKTQKFVNIFDEIDTLLANYKAELDSIDENLPQCLKVEKETVLSNLIKVLNHLKNLKK